MNGRVTFLRFKVDGPKPPIFTEEHLGRLEEFQSGRQKIASADGIDAGWTAGSHVLDKDLRPAKNIVNDALCFDLCVEFDKLPADKLKAYYEGNLAALAKENPTGLPSAKQKREAKESARDRLEEEAKDGRYKKRKCIPVMWDGVSNEVLLGATALTHIDRLVSLFQQTFGYGLDPITSGRLAAGGQAEATSLSSFTPGSGSDAAWIADETSRDFLGNEFILWLWYFSEKNSDTVDLPDTSSSTFMLSRTLTLSCPRGETGHNTIKHEGPTRLPEAKRALRSGKLPRKAGLILVRNSEQFEFALQAETMGVGSAKLPKPPDDVTQARAKLEERVSQIRNLKETVDLMFGAFLTVRFGSEWGATLSSIQKWLAEAERTNG